MRIITNRDEMLTAAQATVAQATVAPATVTTSSRAYPDVYMPGDVTVGQLLPLVESTRDITDILDIIDYGEGEPGVIWRLAVEPRNLKYVVEELAALGGGIVQGIE